MTGLPEGTVATLDGRRQVAREGRRPFPRPSRPAGHRGAEPALPGDARPVRFARHTYWPGTRYSFAPGT